MAVNKSYLPERNEFITSTEKGDLKHKVGSMSMRVYYQINKQVRKWIPMKVQFFPFLADNNINKNPVSGAVRTRIGRAPLHCAHLQQIYVPHSLYVHSRPIELVHGIIYSTAPVHIPCILSTGISCVQCNSAAALVPGPDD
jgi:hypothetical protein